MPEIYCKKCGLRGNSKCPHCRSIFPDRRQLVSSEDYLKDTAQEYFEMFMEVGLYSEDPEDQKKDRSRLTKGEEVRYKVSFWTYARGSDEAVSKILQNLLERLPLANLKVAACVHDWEIMPGQISSIDCGHKGSPEGTEILPDPFAAS